MKKIGTLKKAFFVVILPIIAFLILLLFIIMQRVEMIEEYGLLQLKLENQMRILEDQFSYPLWIVNNERIELLTNILVESPEIAGVNIYDDRNEIISSNGSTAGLSKVVMDYTLANSGKLKTGYKQLFKIIFSSVSWKDYNPQYLVDSKPLYFKTDGAEVLVGYIFLTISDEAIVNSMEKHILIFLVSLLLTFILMSVSISIAYYYRIQNPIGRIRNLLKEKEMSGLLNTSDQLSYDKDDLTYIKERFETLWSRQDRLLQEQFDSKEYYRNLLNSLPMAILLINSKGDILETNSSFRSLTGYSENETHMLTIHEITTQSQEKLIHRKLENLLKEGQLTPFNAEIKIKEGAIVPVNIKAARVKKGFERKLLISMENISARLVIEKDLQRSNRFLNTTSQIAKVGGWELDTGSMEMRCTHELKRIFQIDESVNPTLDKLISQINSDYHPVVNSSIKKAIESGVPFEVEIQIQTDVDKEKWIALKAQPVYHKKKIASLSGTIQDISDRKKNEEEFFTLQKELNHRSRLDMIGQLASGVAHDFNNILNGIMSAAELMRMKLGDESKDLQKYLNIIIGQSESAALLSSRLLTFSRKEIYSREIIDLADLLEDTVSIMKNTFDRKISISLYQEGKPKVYADYSSLQNAIMNICINSSHAMADGGSLSISVETEDKPTGQFESITISDTGTGIKKEIMDRIFEPFFTTKKNGEGTGLGLSAVKRTIEDHKGSIEIESVEGEGTTIRVSLPTQKDVSSEYREVQEVIPGSGTIMLVDDEDINRLTGKDILESMGYKVLLATNGAEAVKIYEDYRNQIDLIILDMVMPVMDGSEAFFKIKDMDMSAKIIILSGFAENKKLSLMMDIGVDAVMSKPFKATEISKVIFEILQ